MHRRGSNNVSKPRQWIMYIWNIKNAKLIVFAFGMPPSCYRAKENCFMLNWRAHYLVLYLSQGGISLIFIRPLNLCLCNLSGRQASCLILFSIRERGYRNSVIKPLFSPAWRALWAILLHINQGVSTGLNMELLAIGIYVHTHRYHSLGIGEQS